MGYKTPYQDYSSCSNNCGSASTNDDVEKIVCQAVLRVLNALTYSFFYKTQTGNVDYNPHFIDEETVSHREIK